MEPIKINVPKGFKAAFDETKGEVSFEPLPKQVTERIKAVADAIAELGDDDKDVQLLKRLDESHGHLFFEQQAIVITKALNEGWIPDWNNGQWDKWFIWFKMDASAGSGFAFLGGFDHWYTNSTVGSRLCFKSKALAEYAGKQFTDIYKKFMTI